jgi:hypothetical protein
MRGALVLGLLLPAVALAAPRKPAAPRPPAQAAPPANDDRGMRKVLDEASCSGEYADSTLVLSSEAREFEHRPEANYSYCVRNTATYECLSYGLDGKIRKKPINVVAHGTAFAYREKNGEYFLLTNDHVATWPLVTEADQDISEVPAGCKKVAEDIRLVRDESDDYEPGQIVVQKVVTDPALDAAVLKTRQQLNIMPYRIGRSALLKAGNVVQVRGYPLGLMQATNGGKIVSASDVDREKVWHHTDFVMDALVTKGNSGSPVFAASCRTGALELVGLYHAGYKDSPALNVAIGIDQLHDLMDNFKRSKPPPDDSHDPIGPAERARIVEALQNPQTTPYFRVGDRIARARLLPDGHITFEIMDESFPAKDLVAITLEEAPSAKGGVLQLFSVSFEAAPIRRATPEDLDAEAQAVAGDLYAVVQRQFLLTLQYRASVTGAGRSREAYRRAGDLAKELESQRGEATDVLKSAFEVASRLPVVAAPMGSSPGDLTKSIVDLVSKVGQPSQTAAATPTSLQP